MTRTRSARRAAGFTEPVRRPAASSRQNLTTRAPLVVLCNVPASPREAGHPAYDLCPPRVGTGRDRSIQSVQDLVVTQITSLHFFAEIARAWNQSPRSWRRFRSSPSRLFQYRVQQRIRHPTANRPRKKQAAATGPSNRPPALGLETVRPPKRKSGRVFDEDK